MDVNKVLEGKKATYIRLDVIFVGTCTRGGLGKLSIQGSNTVRGVTGLGLSTVVRGCHSLKAHTLWNIPAVLDESLLEIGKDGLSLEKLELIQCPSISNKRLVAIAKSSPKLTLVSLESCSKIGNESHRARKMLPQTTVSYYQGLPSCWGSRDCESGVISYKHLGKNKTIDFQHFFYLTV